jgi:hypothetical protein
MLKIQTLPDGIIEISHTGIFTIEHWRDYQKSMIDMLNASDKKLYILSDFSQTERFDKEIVPEAGTAPHLVHENMGLIVLLGGNALHNFILQLTQNRARKDDKDTKLRVHTDRDRALETLRHFRMIHANPDTPFESQI